MDSYRTVLPQLIYTNLTETDYLILYVTMCLEKDHYWVITGQRFIASLPAWRAAGSESLQHLVTNNLSIKLCFSGVVQGVIEFKTLFFHLNMWVIISFSYCAFILSLCESSSCGSESVHVQMCVYKDHECRWIWMFQHFHSVWHKWLKVEINKCWQSLHQILRLQDIIHNNFKYLIADWQFYFSIITIIFFLVKINSIHCGTTFILTLLALR